MLHTSCVLGVCSCWPGPGAMSPAAGSGERAGKGRQQCLNDGAVPLGNCSRVLQPTCPSFRRRLASWTCCDASWTICTSACCSTTAAWAAASPSRGGRALMRFSTQFPSTDECSSRALTARFGWLPFSSFRYDCCFGSLIEISPPKSPDRDPSLRNQAPDAYIHNQNNSPVLYHKGGY